MFYGNSEVERRVADIEIPHVRNQRLELIPCSSITSQVTVGVKKVASSFIPDRDWNPDKDAEVPYIYMQ